MSGSWSPRDFPNLTDSDYDKTSDQSVEYNCIAWSARDTDAWWWPDPNEIGYWPEGVPREQSIGAFILLYTQVLGYEECDNAAFEQGFEKIALYANARGEPTHAARQLPSGRWTSKLGRNEDIDHANLDCLNGDLYGRPVKFLRKRIVLSPPTP